MHEEVRRRSTRKQTTQRATRCAETIPIYADVSTHDDIRRRSSVHDDDVDVTQRRMTMERDDDDY